MSSLSANNSKTSSENPEIPEIPQTTETNIIYFLIPRFSPMSSPSSRRKSRKSKNIQSVRSSDIENVEKHALLDLLEFSATDAYTDPYELRMAMQAKTKVKQESSAKFLSRSLRRMRSFSEKCYSPVKTQNSCRKHRRNTSLRLTHDQRIEQLAKSTHCGQKFIEINEDKSFIGEKVFNFTNFLLMGKTLEHQPQHFQTSKFPYHKRRMTITMRFLMKKNQIQKLSQIYLQNPQRVFVGRQLSRKKIRHSKRSRLLKEPAL